MKKKRNLFLYLLLISSFAFSQKQTYDEPQWKLRLFFEDAAGAKDTLIIGYDPTASIYLDEYEPQFGEVFEQADTTKFNVYTQRDAGQKHPIYPPIDTDMLMKTTITSWNKPYTEIGFVHGQLPVTITWEEIELDSPNLPNNFIDYEDYPKARIDLWFSTDDVMEPSCVNWIVDPTPPTVILSSNISYNWPLEGCKFSDELFLDCDFVDEIGETVSVPTLIIEPYKDVYWIDSSNIDEELDKSFTIYPNPSSHTLYIDNPEDLTIQSIKVYSVFGQLVIDKRDNFNKIDVSNLSKSIYFAEINTTLGKTTRRIVKK